MLPSAAKVLFHSIIFYFASGVFRLYLDIDRRVCCFLANVVTLLISCVIFLMIAKIFSLSK